MNKESSTPTITGLNHVLLVCKDMNRTADFYVNVLGLKLKAASAVGRSMVSYGERTEAAAKLAGRSSGLNRLYFFEAPDGMMIVFAELPDGDPTAEHSFFQPNLWPGEWHPPEQPRKMDHISFNVNTMEELVWFSDRLKAHGVAVSEIENRLRYVKSLYFYDPDQIPLEIATWDYGSPEWKDYKAGDHIQDPDLVPSLRPDRK